MSTSTTIDPVSEQARPGREGRLRAAPARPGWAYAGAAAGLAGIVAIQASLAIDATFDPRYAGDADRITARLGDFIPQILVVQLGMALAAVLLIVFAAGLRRRLRSQGPAGSLLPDVASGGLVLTSVAALMGGGLGTETVFGLAAGEGQVTPEFAVVAAHWLATVPWLWLGAGVTGVALAVAALRHAAAPRWIGWVSAVLGGLTLLTGLSPLQYMAGFTGPVLVLVLGLGFALGDRGPRTTR